MKDNACILMQIIWGGGGVGGGGKQGVLYSNIISLFFMFFGNEKSKRRFTPQRFSIVTQHFHVDHNACCLLPKLLLNYRLRFLLGRM